MDHINSNNTYQNSMEIFRNLKCDFSSFDLILIVSIAIILSYFNIRLLKNIPNNREQKFLYIIFNFIGFFFLALALDSFYKQIQFRIGMLFLIAGEGFLWATLTAMRKDLKEKISPENSDDFNNLFHLNTTLIGVIYIAFTVFLFLADGVDYNVIGTLFILSIVRGLIGAIMERDEQINFLQLHGQAYLLVCFGIYLSFSQLQASPVVLLLGYTLGMYSANEISRLRSTSFTFWTLLIWLVLIVISLIFALYSNTTMEVVYVLIMAAGIVAASILKIRNSKYNLTLQLIILPAVLLLMFGNYYLFTKQLLLYHQANEILLIFFDKGVLSVLFIIIDILPDIIVNNPFTTFIIYIFGAIFLLIGREEKWF
jgi:hypothetical protein